VPCCTRFVARADHDDEAIDRAARRRGAASEDHLDDEATFLTRPVCIFST
jgi:hypothetical protein